MSAFIKSSSSYNLSPHTGPNKDENESSYLLWTVKRSPQQYYVLSPITIIPNISHSLVKKFHANKAPIQMVISLDTSVRIDMLIQIAK